MKLTWKISLGLTLTPLTLTRTIIATFIGAVRRRPAQARALIPRPIKK
jgi:hypothetical protein